MLHLVEVAEDELRLFALQAVGTERRYLQLGSHALTELSGDVNAYLQQIELSSRPQCGPGGTPVCIMDV
jgi:hypothetical protein